MHQLYRRRHSSLVCLLVFFNKLIFCPWLAATLPPLLLLLLPLPPPLLLPPLGGGLFAGGLLLLLLGGGLEVFGLDVGHLPLESGCDPSGRVCVVVTEGALIMFTGCSVPVLLLGFVAFPAGLIVPGATLIMEPKIVIAAVPYEIVE